jgi:hypothetical protein
MRDNVSINCIIKLLKEYIRMFIKQNVKQPEPWNQVMPRTIKSASGSCAADVVYYNRKEEWNQTGQEGSVKAHLQSK